MGRGGKKRTNDATYLSALRVHEIRISGWRRKMHAALSPEISSLEEIMSAKSRSLRPLTQSSEDQKNIIRAARAAAEVKETFRDKNATLFYKAERLEKDAREIFILCHRGYVENIISKHTQRFDSESPETAREILQQVCDIGLNKAIDKYDFDQTANPLTYATRWIHAEIKVEAEAGRRIRLKSKANALGDKIEREVKHIEDSGKKATIRELATRLGESEKKIAEMLPVSIRNSVRLDAPVSAREGDALGEIIADEKSEFRDRIEEASFSESLKDALSELTPFERKAVEISFGLGDGQVAQQKDLFDGLYLDNKGKKYSAKKSVIKKYADEGEVILHKSQKEINKLYNEGELSFIPKNPEAAELARAAKGEIPEGVKLEKKITRETGTPPTTGTVQEALRKGLEKLRTNPKLEGLDIRYRGPREIENSAMAQEELRKELLRVENLSNRQKQILKENNILAHELEELGKKYNLVDSSGRLRR